MKYFQKHFILSLSLLAAILVQASALKVEKYQLDNGLTVYLNENHLKPEVFGAVVVKAGSKDDPDDATGMAHYMEHMLFKGTTELGTTDWEKEKPHVDSIFMLYDQLAKTKVQEERDAIQQKINDQSLKAAEYAIPNEFSNVVKSMGGTHLNAGTGPDQTLFYNAFPSCQLEKWLDLYSHRFIHPVFRSFQAELEVVYEEKNMYADMFIYNLIEEFKKSFFKNHPYGQRSSIGTIEDLKNPSLTKMYDFFKTYYVANNMALVLSGDFDTEKVKPKIEQYFGKLPTREIPERKTYPEEDFEGREIVEANLSPIKIDLLGFRTVTRDHPDYIALEVCNKVLSNSTKSGLLDQLVIHNEVMQLQVIPISFKDHGATLILVIPKIMGQDFEEAEQLVFSKIEQLKAGDVDESILKGIKNQLYLDFQLKHESNEKQALSITSAFSHEMDVKEYFNYTRQVQAITMEDIQRVANKYYGKNYLAFHSKMGKAEQEKIEKPGYKPLVSNTNARSAYAKRLDSMGVDIPEAPYIDFENDVQQTQLNDDIKLYRVENPMNEIFTLEMVFGAGGQALPLIPYGSRAMEFAGTDSLDAGAFKRKMNLLGCDYSIWSDLSYTHLKLEGMEENLATAVALVSELVNKPSIPENVIDKLVEEEKATRKVETSEPDKVAHALYEYIQHGEKSPYLDRSRLKDIKKLETSTLEEEFQKALGYTVVIHYTGKLPMEQVKSTLQEQFAFQDELQGSPSPVTRPVKKVKEDMVYFVKKKDALQSKIYLYSLGKAFKTASDAYRDAFNMYFGGGFSGIVLQEIREYRSLAYAAGATYRIPPVPGKPCIFVGYVGTQADKSIEALTLFKDLYKNMPQKPERAGLIKNYLQLSLFTDRPSFRSVSKKMVEWQHLGYPEDPAKVKMQTYRDMNFSEIYSYYQENIQKNPLAIGIVGDKNAFDLDALEQFGKLKKVKEKHLFTK